MHAYLLTASHDWINPARVVIGSILKIDPTAYVYVYTFDPDVSSMLNSTFSDGNLKCVVLEDRPFVFSTWFSETYSKPNYMALRVLALDHLLKNDSVEKILYLDTDTLPMSGMLDIWEENTHGKALSAVRDIGRSSKEAYGHISKFTYDDWFDRFNGGVMLFDLQVIRSMYPDGLELTENSYAEYRLADQDFLFDKFKHSLWYLPYQYNYFGDPRAKRAIGFDYMLSGLVYSAKSSRVIHFVGPCKPWIRSIRLDRNITILHRLIALPYHLYYERCLELSHLLDEDFLDGVKQFYNQIGIISRSLIHCYGDS